MSRTDNRAPHRIPVLGIPVRQEPRNVPAEFAGITNIITGPNSVAAARANIERMIGTPLTTPQTPTNNPDSYFPQ